jgi:hypothetical protein
MKNQYFRKEHHDRVEKFSASDGQIACHYTPNPINYDLRNKSIPELLPLITI